MKKSPLASLEGKRAKVLALLDAELQRQLRVQNGIGFGYAMRAYSKLKNRSFKREDELKARLETVEKQMRALGWKAPGEVERVLTDEEGIRHYCEVMGVDVAAYRAALAEREQGLLTANGAAG